MTCAAIHLRCSRLHLISGSVPRNTTLSSASLARKEYALISLGHPETGDGLRIGIISMASPKEAPDFLVYMADRSVVTRSCLVKVAPLPTYREPSCRLAARPRPQQSILGLGLAPSLSAPVFISLPQWRLDKGVGGKQGVVGVPNCSQQHRQLLRQNPIGTWGCTANVPLQWPPMRGSCPLFRPLYRLTDNPPC